MRRGQLGVQVAGQSLKRTAPGLYNSEFLWEITTWSDAFCPAGLLQTLADSCQLRAELFTIRSRGSGGHGRSGDWSSQNWTMTCRLDPLALGGWRGSQFLRSRAQKTRAASPTVPRRHSGKLALV